ncbi:MAG TPA: hypothetical protein VK457_24485, partial [Chloroflexota bacterium]|nr:hypothetical protein [Chloroflexota bacterium]
IVFDFGGLRQRGSGDAGGSAGRRVGGGVSTPSVRRGVQAGRCDIGLRRSGTCRFGGRCRSRGSKLARGSRGHDVRQR